MPTDTPTGEPAETAIPTCTSPAALTPALTEGPYYTPGSPERASLLEDGLTGTVLVLSGYVLTPDCQPVGHAWLDFWQADANGVYDNSGYILRGHQYADENGYYQLTTVVPGIYTGRTEHIHFKVQAPEGPILTSQLFFPGIAQNDQDGIFDPALVITITGQAGDTIEATINIILNP
jgi:protocatechuate 3,4-dioxygenase beta subunit